MSTVEMDKLELEIKRARDVGLILANQLNEKIDECEELKNQKSLMDKQFRDEIAENKVLNSEIDRLNNLILTMDIV